MEEKITFGKFITKKRKDADLTQKELAEKLYVTESAVSKWERGISYPDILLVTSICEILNISEHELITASDDLQQKVIEKQAHDFKRILTIYSWVFYLVYGIGLITCFICNLAINHTLSWFFIVLASVMLSFSLTSLPLLLPKHRSFITVAAFWGSLNFLLLVCCIYTGGDWFLVTFVSLLFAFSLVFLPFLLKYIPSSQPASAHKALLYFLANTILLFLLLAVSCTYSGYARQFYTIACPSALYCSALPWFLMLVIRYAKVNALFKASLCLSASGVYIFFTNSVLRVITDHVPLRFQPTNLMIWREPYISGNSTLMTTLVLLGMAVLFAAGGIVLCLQKQKNRE